MLSTENNEIRQEHVLCCDVAVVGAIFVYLVCRGITLIHLYFCYIRYILIYI